MGYDCPCSVLSHHFEDKRHAVPAKEAGAQEEQKPRGAGYGEGFIYLELLAEVLWYGEISQTTG